MSIPEQPQRKPQPPTATSGDSSAASTNSTDATGPSPKPSDQAPRESQADPRDPQQPDGDSSSTAGSNDQADLTEANDEPSSTRPGEKDREDSRQLQLPMANSDSSTTPANDANRTVTGGSTGSSPPREKEADGTASDMAESQDTEREPTQKSSGIAAKPLRLKSGLNVTLTFVRFGQIAGLDEECSSLMLEMDEMAETSAQLEKWDADLLECTSYSQMAILWRKSKKLVHIGSGRILNVLNRISKFDSLIPAFVIENAKLDRNFKLRCIVAEMAVLPSIGRHQNANYEAMMKLLRVGDAAGIKIIKSQKGSSKERSIADATAISYNTVRQYWAQSSASEEGRTDN